MVTFGPEAMVSIPPVYSMDIQELRERFTEGTWRPEDDLDKTKFQARRFLVAEFVAKMRALRTPNVEV